MHLNAVRSTGLMNSQEDPADVIENEPARHKLLDVIGDLALIGRRVKARIVATRPGHSTNVEFAKAMKEAYDR